MVDGQRRTAIGHVLIGERGKRQQIAEPCFVHGDQDNGGQCVCGMALAGRLATHATTAAFLLTVEEHWNLQTDDRLHARLGRFFGEFEGAEQIVGVGDGDGRLSIGLGKRNELGHLQRTLKQRIGRMGS